METIVVGIDGSERAGAALVRAVSQAKLQGARLRVVRAWNVPPEAFHGGFAPGIDASIFDGLRQTAEATVRDALTEAQRIATGLECEGEAVEGQAAEVLLREAQDASLMVVGNRGRGGFASLVLGSGSEQVVHHAHCPVFVVR